MTKTAPQTPAHGEVDEIRPQVARAQDGAVEAVPAYYTPDTLIDDLQEELREAREMVAYLTRANEALTAQIDVLELDARSKETPIPVNLEDL